MANLPAERRAGDLDQLRPPVPLKRADVLVPGLSRHRPAAHVPEFVLCGFTGPAELLARLGSFRRHDPPLRWDDSGSSRCLSGERDRNRFVGDPGIATPLGGWF